MNPFFARLKVGWPDDYRPADDHEGSWKLFTVCDEKSRLACRLRREIGALSHADCLSARSTLVSFSNKAQTGVPLSALYDEKQCHEAFDFKVEEKDQATEKVYRVWGAGVIRVYFMYCEDKRIVLLSIRAKRSDHLTKGEKLEIEAVARSVRRCLRQNAFSEFEV